jgi:CheY-like chemotaxis protein
VLIVDDDEPTRALLAAIVGRRSCRSVECGDGASARALLQEHLFDVILLDLLMPDVNGFDILDYLEDEKPHVLLHVVVITAAAPSLWMGRMGGVQAVIRKPFDVLAVDSAVDACMKGR